MTSKERELLKLMMLFQELKDRFGEADQWTGILTPRARGENAEFDAFLEEMAPMLGRNAEGVRLVIGSAMPILPSNNSLGWWDNPSNLELGYKTRAAALAVGFIQAKHLPALRLRQLTADESNN